MNRMVISIASTSLSSIFIVELRTAMENVEMEVAVTLNNLLDKVEIMVQGRKRKNYHKQVSCAVCKKSMRDDYVKRHMERKHADISFECNNFLTTELLKNNAKYSQQLEMGSKIYDVLCKGLVKEESLKREHKQAFDIYRKQQSQIKRPSSAPGSKIWT